MPATLRTLGDLDDDLNTIQRIADDAAATADADLLIELADYLRERASGITQRLAGNIWLANSAEEGAAKMLAAIDADDC